METTSHETDSNIFLLTSSVLNIWAGNMLEDTVELPQYQLQLVMAYPLSASLATFYFTRRFSTPNTPLHLRKPHQLVESRCQQDILHG